MYKSIFDKLITTEEESLKLVHNGDRALNNCLITYFNQHCYNIYSKNRAYKNLLDNYFNVYIDGMGIYLALRLLRSNVVKKFNASDINEKLIDIFRTNNVKIYLVGGNFPGELITHYRIKLNICGYSNGYFKPIEEPSLLKNIKGLDPDVIIVGMGVPKQELFAVRLSENFKA